MITKLVQKSRSYRRFDESAAVDMDQLRELAGLCRYLPSGANRQPLKYILSCDSVINERIFECLAWAAYLTDWKGPQPGQRPAAYILILGDTAISSDFGCDHGIAAQTIMLGAAEKGLGGCILGAIDRPRLKGALAIPETYNVLLVIALGVPAEEVMVESISAGDSIRYWRDAAGVHHVPKRRTQDLIVGEYKGGT